MTRYMALLAAACLLIAADEPKDNTTKDSNRLQGTWNVVSVERSGAKADDKDTKQLKFTFTDKKATVDRGNKEAHEADYKLNPSAKPKTIDFTYLSGPDEAKTFQGIYELDGDSLKICWSEKGTKRPKELSSKPNSADTLFILQRAKP